MRRFCWALLFGGVLWPALAHAQSEPFGLAVSTDIDFKAKYNIEREWRQIQPKLQADMAAIRACQKNKKCSPAARSLRDLVKFGQGLAGSELLRFVHVTVNDAIRYVPDLIQWAVVERWSAPLETFATRKGDCEDYVLAKMALLLMLGVAPHDLRMVVVQTYDQWGKKFLLGHVILAAYVDNAWWVSDYDAPDIVRTVDSTLAKITPLNVLDWREMLVPPSIIHSTAR